MTPFRFHTNAHEFIYPIKGKSIWIQMATKIQNKNILNTKYLHEIKYFENLEYRLPMNVWIEDEKYKVDLKKIKFI